MFDTASWLVEHVSPNSLLCARPARCSYAGDQLCLLLRSPAAQISGVTQSLRTASSGEMLSLIGDLQTDVSNQRLQ